jgi:hypothetical protein
MKFCVPLLLILLQVQHTQGASLFCPLFGWLGKILGGGVGKYLSPLVVGKGVPITGAAPYRNLTFTNITAPAFNGCDFSLEASGTILGDPIVINNSTFNTPPLPLTVKVKGTFDILRLLFTFRFCVNKVNLTAVVTLPSQLSSFTGLLTTITNQLTTYLNILIPDPFCL